ncbi:hypothetical protein T4B_8661 [Trichinella pseudospiralis]|uniref:Uncharacterized protein n=1 Tax=Trichinella pseudospiralis TaxID=6337 RepID=A0A0V1J2Z0_TRIPS|nr:hypothetical protein T4B_8661 [Trichinella pseudospiralis]
MRGSRHPLQLNSNQLHLNQCENEVFKLVVLPGSSPSLVQEFLLYVAAAAAAAADSGDGGGGGVVVAAIGRRRRRAPSCLPTLTLSLCTTTLTDDVWSTKLLLLLPLSTPGRAPSKPRSSINSSIRTINGQSSGGGDGDNGDVACFFSFIIFYSIPYAAFFIIIFKNKKEKG